MANTMVNIPTDSTGQQWGGDPSTTAVGGGSIGDQEAAALAYYNNNPQMQQWIQQNMGDVAWMMQNPELQAVIVTAAVNKWSSTTLSTALSNTNWWRQNGDAVKQFQQTLATDPGQAQQLILAQKAQIQSYAEALGVQLTDAQLTGYATQAATFQWNTDQMHQAIMAAYQAPTGQGTNTGSAADIEDAIKKTAASYLQPATPDMINWWTAAAVRNNQNPTQVQEELSNFLNIQTKQLYPWMAPALDKGITPQTYLQPYTTAAANTLGVSPDSIDWTSPKWQGALLTQGPTLDGLGAPVSVDQFNKKLMQDPAFGYDKTQNAINQAYSTVNTIETQFGAVKR